MYDERDESIGFEVERPALNRHGNPRGNMKNTTERKPIPETREGIILKYLLVGIVGVALANNIGWIKLPEAKTPVDVAGKTLRTLVTGNSTETKQLASRGSGRSTVKRQPDGVPYTTDGEIWYVNEGGWKRMYGLIASEKESMKALRAQYIIENSKR